jgi:hypothetical protein
VTDLSRDLAAAGGSSSSLSSASVARDTNDVHCLYHNKQERSFSACHAGDRWQSQSRVGLRRCAWRQLTSEPGRNRIPMANCTATYGLVLSDVRCGRAPAGVDCRSSRRRPALLSVAAHPSISGAPRVPSTASPPFKSENGGRRSARRAVLWPIAASKSCGNSAGRSMTIQAHTTAGASEGRGSDPARQPLPPIAPSSAFTENGVRRPLRTAPGQVW